MRFFTLSILTLLTLGFAHELLGEPLVRLPGAQSQWLFITGWSLALLSGVWARLLLGHTPEPAEPCA